LSRKCGFEARNELFIADVIESWQHHDAG
jgi:hypothetical protein